jgi:hypothetical protein
MAIQLFGSLANRKQRELNLVGSLAQKPIENKGGVYVNQEGKLQFPMVNKPIINPDLKISVPTGKELSLEQLPYEQSQQEKADIRESELQMAGKKESVASSLARFFPKAILKSALDLIDVFSKKDVTIFTPETPTQKFLYGEEPIKSISREYRETEPQVSATFGKKAGVPLTGLAIFGGTVLDLTPFGGSEKTVLKQIVKESTVEGAVNLGKKLGITDDLIEGFAKGAVKAQDEVAAENLLNYYGDLMKTSGKVAPKAEAGLQSIYQEARKYKTAEEFVKAQDFNQALRISSNKRLTDLGINPDFSKKISDYLVNSSSENSFIKQTQHLFNTMELYDQNQFYKVFKSARDFYKSSMKEISSGELVKSQLTDIWNEANKTLPEVQKGVATASDIEKGIKPQESIFLPTESKITKPIKNISIPKNIDEFNILPFEEQQNIFSKLNSTLQNQIMKTGDVLRSAIKQGGTPLEALASRIVNGEIKIKVIPIEKADFIEQLGMDNYMRMFRNDNSLQAIDELASNVGATTSELRDAIEEALKQKGLLGKQIQEERDFLDAIKIAKRLERNKNDNLIKQIAFERNAKELNSTTLSRIKEKVGIREWKNANEQQLNNVLEEINKLKTGDTTISRIQAESLRDFGITAYTTKREAVQILGEVEKWKDATKSRFFDFFKTIDQKITNTAGKDADKVRDILTRPREEAVNKMFQEEINLKVGMRDMLDGYKINNAKDRGLIMRYGEGRITLEELKKASPDKWQGIVQADKWFRKQYDDLLESTNKELSRFYNQDKLIPKRKDYYTHAQEMGNAWDLVKNTGGDINPVLEQISEFTKPNRKFNPFFLQRKGGKEFVEDAGKAFEAYLSPTLNNKYLTESIVRHKTVADILAHKTIDTKNINSFIFSLRDAADSLAGKTNPFDRALINRVVGRKPIQLINLAAQRMGKNRIIGNIGSALMQISGVPGSVMRNNIIRTSKGLLTQAFSPLLKASDPLLKSQFLLRRYGEKGLQHGETVLPTILQKGEKIASLPFEFIEQNITKSIWRASFDNALSQGFQGKQLIQKADEITASIVGSRGIGEKAMAFESGVLSLPLQFQLEVNTFAQLLKEEVFDQLFKNPLKATRAAIETSITLFLMNTLFENTMGRTPLPDPIRAVSEATEADSFLEGVGRIAGEGFSSVAGGQFIANLLPDDIKKKYFGRSEVGVYPGGVPIAQSLSGGFKNPENFVYDFVLPYGGGQLKKILQGIEGLDKMGSYNKEGKLQFPINQNQWLQVVLFGKYSIPEAKEYFDKQRTTLSDKQTVEYFLRTQDGEKPQDVYNDIIKERLKNEYEREIIKKVIQKIKSKQDEGLALVQFWKQQGIITNEMEKDIIDGLK